MESLSQSIVCFETSFCFVAWAGLKLRILLPQPHECWDDAYVAKKRLLKLVFLTVISKLDVLGHGCFSALYF